MDRRSTADHSYCFGPFRLDASRQQLYKDEQPVELARRFFRALQLLVENHGRDLEKSYLMEQLWPDAIVEENNLTVMISVLRKVLGDDSEHKTYILTNPGRGYRFVAKVIERCADVEQLPVSIASSAASALPAARTPNFVRGSSSAIWGFLRPHISPRLVALGAAFLCSFLVLLSVLSWNRRTSAQSVAVLPFQSLGAESEDGYLGLGMADALIMRLHNIRRVAVRPTSDVLKYQKTAHDPQTVGRELNVVSLLDGTIQRAGDQIFLRVKLLRVKDGAVLWSEEYRGKFEEILRLQDQIAEQATHALALKLNSEERQSIHKHYTGSSDAYQMYIAARYYCSAGSNQRSLERGVSYFQQATASDPQFALAYGSLAACYIQLADSADQPPREFLSKAEAAAERALAIDGSLQEAYLPLALAKAYYDWDFKAAESAYKRSIELGPDGAAVHMNYAELLVSLGRFKDAENEAHKAAELDPFSWSADTEVSNVYFFAHRYDEAANRWERDRKVGLDEAPWYLGWIYASEGKQIPMMDELERAETGAPRKAVYTAAKAYLYALQGMKPQAEGCLQKLAEYSDKGVDDYDIALIYTALGEKGKAFQALDRARENRSSSLVWIKVDPRLDSLHSDARWNDLLRLVHLNP